MKALPIVFYCGIYLAHSYKLPFYYAPRIFFNYLSLYAPGMNVTLDFIYMETVKLRGTQSKQKLQDDKFFSTVGF